MDKYEYKVCADEIKSLIAEGDYAEAVKIADTIDWRRVKSVMMLCTISDLYKINRRYQESKDILLLAYEKHPTGRLIVYSLCELSIKMGEYVQAIEYHKEFVQIAPKDTGRYILQYRLYEAQDVSLEERIAVLEEFKKRDYREKWAYELAYLYHRIGLTTKCVEECDEMFLWFGEGKYVLKALELKTLHTPLNADQQAKYDSWIKDRDAEAMEDRNEEATDFIGDAMEEQEDDARYGEGYSDDEEPDADGEDIAAVPTTELPEVKTVDVGQYNTLNLQMALAESMKEILSDEETEMQSDGQEDQTAESQSAQTVSEPEEEPSVAEKIIAPLLQETTDLSNMKLPQDTDELQEISSVVQPEIPQPVQQTTVSQPQYSAEISPESANQSRYDHVLSQEYDGQIRLVVPDEKTIEKQITGQLSIEDILAEWEEMKRNNEQKRMEDVRKRIMENTGSLFKDFDEATKSGLLEQLEKVFVAAIMKESEKPAIKKVILPEDAEEELSKAAQPKPEQQPEPEQEAEPEYETEEAELEFEPEAEIEEEPEEELQEEPRKPRQKPKTPASAKKKQEAPVTIRKISTEPDTNGELAELEELEELQEINKKGQEEQKETEPEVREPQEVSRTDRELTEEETALFGQFIHHRKTKDQLVHTLDNMSMAAYIGNVAITGEEGSDTLSLAKGLIREMQYNDSNFSGKVAKVSGTVLNKKNVAETLSRINNGALILEKAADMNEETITRLGKALERDNIGLLLIMEDTKLKINKLLAENAVLNNFFNLRVDIEPLDDEALVAYAKQYAEEQEYSIDEFGVLALHTRIADMQTSDHSVSMAEVRELVDEAIYYANKKTPKHLVDILLAKRYDDEDMIILRENDFMHY